MTDNSSATPPADQPEAAISQPLDLARESLQQLLEDDRVPGSVRKALAEDYREIQQLFDRLQQGQIHIAVFGRVSVGKSALLNALLDEQKFSTSPLHGETVEAQGGQWNTYHQGNVWLIDTPGINEVDGSDREALANAVAERADLVLFVVDGDLTEIEFQALTALKQQQSTVLLVLNKMDRYSEQDLHNILNALHQRCDAWVGAQNIVTVAADPAPQTVIMLDEQGNETQTTRARSADVEALKKRLAAVLSSEGETLAALNASLFASRLSDQLGEKILEVRQSIGQKIIHTWCTAKGVAVALNPIPVADLVAAAAVDVGMIVNLSRVYDLPLTRNEAGELVTTIGKQMLLLMGTVWAVHLVSSALKLGTGGLSAVVTGGAQGAVAYYSTYIVGQAAEQYLAQGKSWGKAGPKLVIKQILAGIDRESILAQAKKEIASKLGKS